MEVSRLVLWTLGALLAIGGAVGLYYTSGADAYIPPGVALAGLVLLVGVIAMAMAAAMREPVTPVRAQRPRRNVTLVEPVTEREVQTHVVHEPGSRPPSRVARRRSLERRREPVEETEDLRTYR